MSDDLPEPDRREGAGHPRLAPRLVGHQAAEAQVLAAHAAGRMHSGWLIAGPEGIGKATLAYRMAAFLLADPGGLFGAPTSLDLPADDPDLRQVRAGSHPRLLVIRRTVNDEARPPKLRQQIVADDMRPLKTFFQLSAADGGRRVVIIDAADEMNPTAANAILKMLEEPPPGAHLLLVTHQPSRLLPTIRSRCRTLVLHPLAPADLAAALEGAGVAVTDGAALTALAGGSAGRAVQLLRQDGLALYAEIAGILATLPRLDRPRALRLAETAAQRGAPDRMDLLTDLLDLALHRLARAGLEGPPGAEAAPGEARHLARLSPGPGAARAWADLQGQAIPRLRQGQAVNLDPQALILDMLLALEATAQAVAPS